jgi:hypothetical protein
MRRKRTIEGTTGRAREAAGQLSDAAAGAAHRVTDQTGPVFERARDEAGTLLERAREEAMPVFERAREVPATLAERARDEAAPLLVEARWRARHAAAAARGQRPQRPPRRWPWVAGALGVGMAAGATAFSVLHRRRRAAEEPWPTGDGQLPVGPIDTATGEVGTTELRPGSA